MTTAWLSGIARQERLRSQAVSAVEALPAVVLAGIGLWLATGTRFGTTSADAFAVLLLACSCFALALGLWRRKTWTWWVAVGAFGGAAFALGATFGRLPLATLIVLALLVLLLSRRRYDVGTSRNAAGAAATLLVIGVACSVAGLVPVAGLAAVAASLLLLRPVPDQRPADELARACDILAARGTGSLQPYRLLRPASAIADESGRAAFAYARAGRTAVVLGEPSGESIAAWRTFGDWTIAAKRHDWRPVMYQAGREGRDRLERAGWHSVLVGMEAIVDPSGFRLGSPRLANVRHTVTRSQKGGVRVAWSRYGLRDLPDRTALSHGMAAVDEAWRKTAGVPLGFTVGHFAENRLDDAAVAVATSDGSVVAFVVLRPTRPDGGSWMLDVIRRLPGSVPGAVEACLAAAIEGLGADGVTELSLGLAPLHGLDTGEGPGAQRLLALGAKLIRPMYDYPGLAFFKGKFDPLWEPRYLVVPSRGDFLTASIALLLLHLGGTWTAIARSFGAGLAPRRMSRRWISDRAEPNGVPTLVSAAVNGLRKPHLSTTDGNAQPAHGQDEEP
jgi:phosphatidylglycerol lysyltransferase